MKTLKKYTREHNNKLYEYYDKIISHCKLNNLQLVIKVLEHLRKNHTPEQILREVYRVSGGLIWNILDRELIEICEDNLTEEMRKMAYLCNNNQLEDYFHTRVYKRIATTVIQKAVDTTEIDSIENFQYSLRECITSVIMGYVCIYIAHLELKDE